MARRKPYDPAKKGRALILNGQMGIPNQFRQQHSSGGFDVEQLAVGYDRSGGVVRSRERAMLTNPTLLTELYNGMICKYQAAGQEIPLELKIPQTPSDRATAGQRSILWAYIRTRIEVVTGKVNITNYEGAPKASDLNRVPLNDNQFNRRRFYEWIREQPGMAVMTDFLDAVVAQCNPELYDDAEKVLGKAELGMNLIDTENARDGKNAADGALSICSRILAEAAADFAVIERRHARAVHHYRKNTA